MKPGKYSVQKAAIRNRIGSSASLAFVLLVLTGTATAPAAGADGNTGDTGRTYRFTREYALDGSWGEAGRPPGSIVRESSVEPLLLADASPAAGGPAPAVSLESLHPDVAPRLVVWGFKDLARFDQPAGTAIDPRDGSIAVANTGAHRIEFFSSRGRPLLQVIHRVTAPDGEEADGTPCALAYDAAGRLLVADNAADYVDVLDRRGRSIARLAIPAGRPHAVGVARAGVIYVGTTGEASAIYRFGRDYKPAGSWGVSGKEPGQLNDVTAIAELPDGTIAVACARTKYGIQIFSAGGDYVRGFGTHDIPAGNLSLPSGIVGTGDGRIWVSDEIRQTIEVFTTGGEYIAAVHGSGYLDGDFSYPSALATDGKGLLAVAERGGRLQVLSISKHEEVSAGEQP